MRHSAPPFAPRLQLRNTATAASAKSSKLHPPKNSHGGLRGATWGWCLKYKSCTWSLGFKPFLLMLHFPVFNSKRVNRRYALWLEGGQAPLTDPPFRIRCVLLGAGRCSLRNSSFKQLSYQLTRFSFVQFIYPAFSLELKKITYILFIFFLHTRTIR